MRIVRLASASFVAIAFAATLGSVSTSGQSGTAASVKAVPVASAAAPTASSKPVAAPARFATLARVKAVPMSSGELDAVKGLHVHFVDAGGGQIHLAGDPTHMNNWSNIGGSDGLPVAPSYNGLCVAVGAGGSNGITIPGAAVQCP